VRQSTPNRFKRIMDRNIETIKTFVRDDDLVARHFETYAHVVPTVMTPSPKRRDDNMAGNDSFVVFGQSIRLATDQALVDTGFWNTSYRYLDRNFHRFHGFLLPVVREW
jgi:hypothetical protein